MAQQPEKFLPLKTHWFHVLAALSDEPQHGYAIMQDILERTGGKVKLWPPTLYGTIRRLLDEGLIEETASKLSAEAGDPRRRYYRMTALGQKVLRAECDRLEDLIRAVKPKRLRERNA